MADMRIVRAIVALITLAGAGAALAQEFGRSPDDYDDRRGPGRGGRAVATFFVKDKFGGRGVTIDRPVRDMGEFDLNDKVSSIDVRRGAWLVCTDYNFQGRCTTIDRSVRRLDGMGFDDKISSVRPIRDRDR